MAARKRSEPSGRISPGEYFKGLHTKARLRMDDVLAILLDRELTANQIASLIPKAKRPPSDDASKWLPGRMLRYWRWGYVARSKAPASGSKRPWLYRLTPKGREKVTGKSMK